MLEVRNVRTTFGSLVAVDDVSFTVEPGKLTGLLGPNGAGKTTTVSMIAGLAQPEKGSVEVGGQPVGGDTNPLKKKIGLVPQDLALYDELSARDNLLFFGALYNLSGAALESAMSSALALVGLADRARDRVKTFSGGMKRRLNLAAGLLHDPDILLLDEPTVGVDPQSRNAIFFQPRDAVATRQGAAVHDALHGRGRAARRSHRHHRPRPRHCQRHAGRSPDKGARGS